MIPEDIDWWTLNRILQHEEGASSQLPVFGMVSDIQETYD